MIRNARICRLRDHHELAMPENGTLGSSSREATGTHCAVRTCDLGAVEPVRSPVDGPWVPWEVLTGMRAVVSDPGRLAGPASTGRRPRCRRFLFHAPHGVCR